MTFDIWPAVPLIHSQPTLHERTTVAGCLSIVLKLTTSGSPTSPCVASACRAPAHTMSSSLRIQRYSSGRANTNASAMFAFAWTFPRLLRTSTPYSRRIDAAASSENEGDELSFTRILTWPGQSPLCDVNASSCCRNVEGRL